MQIKGDLKHKFAIMAGYALNHDVVRYDN